MDIIPLGKEHLREAASLFIENFKQLRRKVLPLPDPMEDPAIVLQKLDHLLQVSNGVAALQAGRLAGFLSWYVVDRFRNTDRRGAYCPEWGHGAGADTKETVRALYRAAAEEWAVSGCQVHAVSILAHDQQAVDAWFWNGFGLTVVDAIRLIQPLGFGQPVDLAIRKAGMEDLQALSILDNEHIRHYQAAPVFMVAPYSMGEPDWLHFLTKDPNSAWIGLDGDHPVGFLRLEYQSFGAASIVQSETTIAITGLYVRPQYRHRGVAAGLLDAALRYYADLGFERCSVDFESFNPEAASFWSRYFQPVCFSLTRIPEVT